VTYYYEDLTVGLSESISHTVTERDVELFGEATGDRNPLHFDEAYARKTIFRGRVVHGALAIGYISAVMGTKLPGPGSIFLNANIRFKAPVRIGDTVVTTATVTEIHQRREVLIACKCEVNGKLVMEAEGLVMAPRKPPTKPGAA
jgi:3-hydroxybutyryl-CoA dehydratase